MVQSHMRLTELLRLHKRLREPFPLMKSQKLDQSQVWTHQVNTVKQCEIITTNLFTQLYSTSTLNSRYYY